MVGGIDFIGLGWLCFLFMGWIARACECSERVVFEGRGRCYVSLWRVYDGLHTKTMGRRYDIGDLD
jgi:hypothetical protein